MPTLVYSIVVHCELGDGGIEISWKTSNVITGSALLFSHLRILDYSKPLSQMSFTINVLQCTVLCGIIPFVVTDCYVQGSC